MIRIVCLLLFVCSACWGNSNFGVDFGVGCNFKGEQQVRNRENESTHETSTGYAPYIEIYSHVTDNIMFGGGVEAQFYRSYRYGDEEVRFSYLPVYSGLKYAPSLTNKLVLELQAHAGANILAYGKHEPEHATAIGTTYYAIGCGLRHDSGVSLSLLARVHFARQGITLDDNASGWGVHQTNLTLRLGYRFADIDRTVSRIRSRTSGDEEYSRITSQVFIGANLFNSHQISNTSFNYGTAPPGFSAGIELLYRMTPRFGAGLGSEGQFLHSLGDWGFRNEESYGFTPVYFYCAIQTPTFWKVKPHLLVHLGYAFFHANEQYLEINELKEPTSGGIYWALGWGIMDQSGFGVDVLYRRNKAQMKSSINMRSSEVRQGQLSLRLGYRF